MTLNDHYGSCVFVSFVRDTVRGGVLYVTVHTVYVSVRAHRRSGAKLSGAEQQHGCRLLGARRIRDSV